MPLAGTESTLSTAIYSALVAEFGALQQENLQKLADCIANAVVPHITANAVVTGTCPTSGGPLTGGLVT